MPGRIVIAGAGPCGLGAADELVRLGHRDLVVLEATDRAGGLAASVVDGAGFTWDLGGHVVFSHHGEFDRVLDEVMGDELLHHERASFIRVADCWVPYPYQNNLHRLPPELIEAALTGLAEAAQRPAGAEEASENFAVWMARTFGSGIVEQFMRPYNEKVWACPAESMTASWIAERVAVVSWREALHSVVTQVDNPGWGPNSMFAFPATGGTGEIYRRLAARLGDLVHYRRPITAVDPVARTVTTPQGVERYDALVWTGSLDLLVHAIAGAPAEVRKAADELTHNSVTMVGLGYESPLQDERSWLYFPDPDVPFYRATNFAKYSPANVPGGNIGRYSSWMTEIASSPGRPLTASDDELVGEVDDALRRVGLVPAGAPIASAHVEHIPRAYPVPTLARDAALAVIQPWLMEHDILSRGRFGAWRYELGNMDHAVKMGVDVARRLVHGTPEAAWS